MPSGRRRSTDFDVYKSKQNRSSWKGVCVIVVNDDDGGVSAWFGFLFHFLLFDLHFFFPSFMHAAFFNRRRPNGENQTSFPSFPLVNECSKIMGTFAALQITTHR